MYPPRKLMGFFCQWFRLVWFGWLPHTHFAPAADNGHFEENNGDSWNKICLQKKKNLRAIC